MFSRYVLRTTDPTAARTFYFEVLGLTLPDGASGASDLECWPLHERARSMGVPSHWLGHIEVADVATSADRIVRSGGERLGPPVEADGIAYATVRDPFGAVISVTDRTRSTEDSQVAWHQLHVSDADQAWPLYSELSGWVHTETIEMPGLDGGHRFFAFLRGGASVGSIGNTARWPGVHPHWLFYFPAVDIEIAAGRVRSLGGTAMEPAALPDGTRLSTCEDPQGAAFGLLERSKQAS